MVLFVVFGGRSIVGITPGVRFGVIIERGRGEWAGRRKGGDACATGSGRGLGRVGVVVEVWLINRYDRRTNGWGDLGTRLVVWSRVRICEGRHRGDEVLEIWPWRNNP